MASYQNVGAVIGTGIGLGSAIYEQGIKGVGEDIAEIGKGIGKGISSIASSIASWF